MNKRVKKKWLEALRSGEYKQGTGRLKTTYEDGPKHCCLGVLCEIYQKEMVEKGMKPLSVKEVNEIKKGTVTYFGGSEEYLPKTVAKWANISCDGSINLSKDVELRLDFENDNGTSFEEIANKIEKYL